jgi:hypothetical protein
LIEEKTMEARLNLTWAGFNGDLQDPVNYDASDEDIRRFAAEALVYGIPGIPAQPHVRPDDMRDMVVQRFESQGDLGPKIIVRPKVPFGGL